MIKMYPYDKNVSQRQYTFKEKKIQFVSICIAKKVVKYYFEQLFSLIQNCSIGRNYQLRYTYTRIVAQKNYCKINIEARCGRTVISSTQENEIGVRGQPQQFSETLSQNKKQKGLVQWKCAPSAAKKKNK